MAGPVRRLFAARSALSAPVFVHLSANLDLRLLMSGRPRLCPPPAGLDPSAPTARERERARPGAITLARPRPVVDRKVLRARKGLRGRIGAYRREQFRSGANLPSTSVLRPRASGHHHLLLLPFLLLAWGGRAKRVPQAPQTYVPRDARRPGAIGALERHRFRSLPTQIDVERQQTESDRRSTSRRASSGARRGWRP